MNETAIKINRLKEQINKLERDFRKGKGVHEFMGFTLQIHYGGNKDPDLKNVCIGSISDEKEVTRVFYDMVLRSLKNSLKYYEEHAIREINEIQKALNSL